MYKRQIEGRAPHYTISLKVAKMTKQIGQRLENEGAQEVVAHDASEIADEGCPRDVASVPSKADPVSYTHLNISYITTWRTKPTNWNGVTTHVIRKNFWKTLWTRL